MLNPSHKLKFRPVLTARQIEHILTLCRSETPLTQESLGIVATLSPYYAKIQNAGVVAAYNVSDSRKVENKLGFETGNTGSSEKIDWIQVRKQAYEKYVQNPNLCSVDELNYAHQYRFDNGLMSTDESEKYIADSISNQFGG